MPPHLSSKPQWTGGKSTNTHWHVRELQPGAPAPNPINDEVIAHNVEWLLAQCDRSHKAVQLLEHEEGVSVPLFVHDGVISFSLGEVSITSVSVRRHVLVGNFADDLVADWSGALDHLCESLGPSGVVFLLGIVQDEALHRALLSSDSTKRYLVLPRGDTYARRLCNVQGGLDAYLASLPAKSRQDLKRSRRRFEDEFGTRASFATYSSAEDVEVFLSKVEDVSRLTYQGRNLGLAISSSGYIGNKVREGARRGYARCYLIEVDGTPVAWRIGFLYGGTYFSHHVGYNPDYAHFHPGVVMHLYSIDELTRSSSHVNTLDMLYGDNDFKRKAANRFRKEQNYYLFPLTLRGRLIFHSLKASEALSRFLGAALERLGLKSRIRSLIRRL